VDLSSLFKVETDKPLNPVKQFSGLFGPGVGTLEGSQVKLC
jgi:hypothetical protein